MVAKNGILYYYLNLFNNPFVGNQRARRNNSRLYVSVCVCLEWYIDDYYRYKQYIYIVVRAINSNINYYLSYIYIQFKQQLHFFFCYFYIYIYIYRYR